MMMRSLAIDLAPRGITCVVVNPGWVRTDMGGSHATLNAGRERQQADRLDRRPWDRRSQASSSITMVANTPGSICASEFSDLR
jgi:NAD(P)-dependent dehydrogenase (short-subunit alcohol dehydrogenase family)